jgi:hypothetical protein
MHADRTREHRNNPVYKGVKPEGNESEKKY